MPIDTDVPVPVVIKSQSFWGIRDREDCPMSEVVGHLSRRQAHVLIVKHREKRLEP